MPNRVVEDRRDLAVRQAHLGVQDRRGGLGVGADLAGRRAQRVGGLERVPALGPLAARLAVADVDAELADQRLCAGSRSGTGRPCRSRRGGPGSAGRRRAGAPRGTRRPVRVAAAGGGRACRGRRPTCGRASSGRASAGLCGTVPLDACRRRASSSFRVSSATWAVSSATCLESSRQPGHAGSSMPPSYRPGQ